MLILIDANEKYLKEYQEAYELSVAKVNSGEIHKSDLMFDDINEADIIQNNPGISVNGVFKILEKINGKVTLDIIRNSIKRELYNLIEHRGSKKTGGYYTKTNVK